MSIEERTDLIETLLWARCIYSRITSKPPAYLEAFVEALAKRLAERTDLSNRVMVDHPSMALAGNLFRRRGDLAFFENGVIHELETSDDGRAALFGSTLFVAYFGAAKSLLDAVSIALTAALKLNLSRKEQDFGKAKFWKALESSGAPCISRVKSFQPFTQEVIRWRDAAVHRISPLLVGNATVGAKSTNVLMASDPDDESPWGNKDLRWVDPMLRLNDWRPHLDALAQDGCEVILGMIG